MKRAGFTMIELIFVIVILGILSAVAVPKMMGVSKKADAGVCKSLYSTLNRTVAPTLWSNVAIDGDDINSTFTAAKIKEQIALDEKCLKSGDDGSELAKIATEAGTTYEIDVDGDGTADYDVNGTVATRASAPTWILTKK